MFDKAFNSDLNDQVEIQDLLVDGENEEIISIIPMDGIWNKMIVTLSKQVNHHNNNHYNHYHYKISIIIQSINYQINIIIRPPTRTTNCITRVSGSAVITIHNLLRKIDTATNDKHDGSVRYIGPMQGLLEASQPSLVQQLFFNESDTRNSAKSDTIHCSIYSSLRNKRNPRHVSETNRIIITEERVYESDENDRDIMDDMSEI